MVKRHNQTVVPGRQVCSQNLLTIYYRSSTIKLVQRNLIGDDLAILCPQPSVDVLNFQLCVRYFRTQERRRPYLIEKLQRLPLRELKLLAGARNESYTGAAKRLWDTRLSSNDSGINERDELRYLQTSGLN